MSASSVSAQPADVTVDLLVVGSGTGLAAALSAHEQGLDVLVVEKTEYVGGSTARSGGAFWIPANPVLAESGSKDSIERGETYLRNLLGDTAPEARWRAFLANGPATVKMLRRTTQLKFLWDRGYSDYHPETPGGSASGRSVESRPFDAAKLGRDRKLLRPGVVEAPVPMPVTGADYKWMNLVARKPGRGMPRILRRVTQGIGGLAIGRRYVAGGQALAAGMFAGVRDAGIPIWRETTLVDLVRDGDRVVGAVVEHHGDRFTVTARRGVVLAAGGFDHDLAMRHEYQADFLENWSLGSEGNTGDAIKTGAAHGADLAMMDQAWWFPAVAPLLGEAPQVLLAERSLPGSLMVDRHGRRFVNESVGYMSFGQTVLDRERSGDPVGEMWLIFDQRYRNSYVFAGALYPRMPLPQQWYDAGIAHRASTVTDLARCAGLPESTLAETLARFNAMAPAGIDDDFGRGNSAYDRYYGDPTVAPNPNLRALDLQDLYAVKVVLSDLGTTGGLRADEYGRPLRTDGSPIEGLYAIGNTAGNVFGHYYPGAGATIGQGLVFGHIVATHAATQPAIAADTLA
ncbi:succinate dehydrogenase/fumarate reductase flavoprotein subunit [Stackebrandtia endophytica]|uniref:3-oxosteroid 1-dehydrogenase n=1 Tax=Stackebrandtia endophytica TaxID=1496996 RepID=A0A543AS48_9ACTN|nr:3-ketosteroid-delta-1-dehydrogenase [Stackebrandtia endophytica]TQL75404.1 succinate dehydrogenase/fumarate reductase flavoprotein subunit [Stackebrandtia endophytica]